MKVFAWNLEKNAWLIAERGISFERVTARIEQGGLLDIVEHPNQDKYPGQRMFIVEIDDYCWLVPFIESASETFLKTAIPSRKATREFLRDLK